MASIQTEEDDFSAYSAYNETDSRDNNSYDMPLKAAMGDANYDYYQRVGYDQSNHHRIYSRDEFLYALSSPSSIGAMAWIVSSFVAVIYGSSIAVFLNFCIPLFVGPFVINEQMPAQLLPSVQKKFNKIRDEANIVAMKNVQLKSRVSRLQRQEYRLSVVEERFEHLCKRSNKDITKSKHLAKRNAALRQSIKSNLAANKIQEVMRSILSPDHNGNCFVSESEVGEIVVLMKVFAGKDAASKFDKEAIHDLVMSSITNNPKVTFIPNMADSDSETRDSEREYNNDGRQMTEAEELEEMYRRDYETDDGDSNKDLSMDSSSRQTYDSPGEHIKRSIEREEELRRLNDKHQSLKKDPSGHLSEKHYGQDKGFQGMVETNVSNGTLDSPIDIEKLLFSGSSYSQTDAE